MPTALVVEDDPSVRSFICLTLELDGWVAVESGDGGEALRLLAQAQPDIVLTDMMMPGVSGLGLLQAMAVDPVLRDVPRVVVSAKDDPVERRLALDLGAVAWLHKPVTPERLLAAAWDHHSDHAGDGEAQTRSRPDVGTARNG